MTFLPTSPQIIGIEITPTSFRVARLKKKRNSWEVASLEEISSEEDLKKRIPKNAVIVTALPSEEILVRPLELPLKKEKDIEAAYGFQAEALLPYPLEKGVIQKINVKSHSEGTLLTILAAKKDHVERHLQFLKTRGVSPCIVSCIPQGLATLSGSLAQEEAKLWIQMGEKEGTLALIEGGKLLTARAFEIEKSEIQNTVLSVLNAYKSKKIESVFLLTSHPEHASLVAESTQKMVLLPKLPLVSEEALQKYGVAISLALSATQKTQVNFLSKEERYFCSLSRVKKPLTAFFALSALLFLTFSMIKNKVLNDEENHLLSRSKTLFEKQPQTLNELVLKLDGFKSEIEKWPDTYPLLPQVPKVGDVLAALSNDPRWQGDHPIEFEDFRYHMCSRPSFDHKSDRYQVKVEITFVASTPSVANAFHEALTSYPFVDNKKEVEWVAGKGKYRASFYLKDKTRYS